MVLFSQRLILGRVQDIFTYMYKILDIAGSNEEWQFYDREFRKDRVSLGYPFSGHRVDLYTKALTSGQKGSLDNDDRYKSSARGISPFVSHRVIASPTTKKAQDVTTSTHHVSLITPALDAMQKNPIPLTNVTKQKKEELVMRKKSVKVMVQESLPKGHPHQSTIHNNALPTPVNVRSFSYLLEGYKHRDYIVKRFSDGFITHFEGQEEELESSNSRAALLNPDTVEAKIQKELEMRRIAGPFKEPPFKNFKCSPLSIREKSTPGQYRLLHNLSYPYDDKLVNHNIPTEHSKVKYATLQDAISIIQHLSPGFYLAKSDIKSAFRIVPLHSSQYHLMGFKWNGLYYFDRCLAMGLSSSCQIFEAISSAIVYILRKRFNVQDVVKVLDVFLFLAKTYGQCKGYLNIFLQLCKLLGIPVAMEPSQTLVFLGILLDNIRMLAQLPNEKIVSYGNNMS